MRACLLKSALVSASTLLVILPAAAQSAGGERLFLGFAQEAAAVEKQWWEGQLEFSDSVADTYDAWILRGVVALRPWANVEMGGRVGFGSTDVSEPGLEDGSGATDLEVWGKYLFGADGDATRFAAGGLVTIPMGDDSVGLGQDAFALQAFGSLVHRMQRFSLSFQGGFRATEDGQIFDAELDGDSSPFLGGAVIWPLSDKFTLIGEARYEGARFENSDKDTRVLGGVNWRALNTGIIRGALAFGLSDGSPDLQFLVGYAAQF